ncbi:MAG: DNA mismatch repair protein MutS [Desulfuromonadaceae bacterium]|nr:DNA mismatch repair protein MutS [Desulfuromonadaceae bacterium]
MPTQTPMMRQYLEIKACYPDAILFFRLGDFYEMFLDDAVTAARVLDIALTSRNRGAADEIPMCGIPYHSSQPYLAKLVTAGYKVAICEQVEDPREVKGLVKREVVRVITPGTAIEQELLEPDVNNFFLVISKVKDAYGVASLDLSTGHFRVTSVAHLNDVGREISAIAPREILVSQAELDVFQQELGAAVDNVRLDALPQDIFTPDDAEARLLRFFATEHLGVFGCADQLTAISAAGAALYYVEQTQCGSVGHIRSLQTYHTSDALILDTDTRRNLEITATMRDKKRRGSLLGAVDRTVTSMGSRTLRQWLTMPLVHVDAICRRHEMVAEAIRQPVLRADMHVALKQIHDLERLNTRISMGSANARDLLCVLTSVQNIPPILEHLDSFNAELASEFRSSIDPLEDVVELLEAALATEPPMSVREGGIIRDGYAPDLDELRTITREGKGWIARLEKQERTSTGINTLKVRYNRVFGYFIDVPRTQIGKVPSHYERKQTLANSERYFTPELKEYEDKVLDAQDRLNALEYEIFQRLRTYVTQQGSRIQTTAESLAALDVLLGFAELAHERNYCCPTMDSSTVLEIEQGRHPVVETMTLGESFVPNDVKLATETAQILVITGPNMAGKSTFMRQVALIVLLAQAGSFVPAQQARIGVVDQIFARVGASDNLAQGQSTFMVEMSETANILNHATPRSLIVLDEIGRGTSTFDGISIAWAVAEFLHNNANVAARTLFATHYHELTELANIHARIFNFNVEVRQWKDKIVFLRRIIPGGASHSYGIQVARLAGLPEVVIARANEVLHTLEQEHAIATSAAAVTASAPASEAHGSSQNADSGQNQLFDGHENPIHARLHSIDIERITPLEAIYVLDELKRLLA